MEFVTGITLSTGKRIRFPVFPSQFTDEYKIYSRGGGVYRIYNYNVLIYSDITDSELLELGNMILGTNYENIRFNYPQEAGYYSINFCWVYNRDLNGFRLSHCFRSTIESGGAIVCDVVQPQWRRGYYFYNNESLIQETVYDFYNTVQYFNDRLPERGFSIKNLRFLGSVPTIDYATCDNVFDDFALGILNVTMSLLTTNLSRYIELHPDSNIDITIFDPDSNSDPYIVNDPSTIGGGFGDRDQDIDSIEKAEIPELPTLSAVSTGLITLYNCTESQLNTLGAYLWSDIFDVETNFKKLFSNPMDCIIGLGIVPVHPTLGGASNVKFGNINTNVSMSKIASQYVELDCGTINLKEFIGSFLDYSPYVKISIYLPYIGFRDLSADDVMNDTIHVVYHVDVLTGGCCAMIETGKKGLLYSFNGSCITNVPITAINYSGAIQNAVSAIGAGATTIAGIATGAAPLTAMGATQLLSAGANTALNSKPTVTRSGSMGGSAGLMSYQKPYIVINRPRMSVPDKLNKFIGNTLNVTMKLSTLKGFTQIELIHLDNIPCTDNERSELLALLKEGVIF